MRTSSIRALQSDTGLDRTAFQTVCVQRRQLGCRRDTARSRCRVPCRGAVAAGRRRSSLRSISPASTPLSSKPAACRCCGLMTEQTDGRTDGLPTATETPLHTMRGIAGSIVHRQANIHH